METCDYCGRELEDDKGILRAVGYVEQGDQKFPIIKTWCGQSDCDPDDEVDEPTQRVVDESVEEQTNHSENPEEIE